MHNVYWLWLCRIQSALRLVMCLAAKHVQAGHKTTRLEWNWAHIKKKRQHMNPAFYTLKGRVRQRNALYQLKISTTNIQIKEFSRIFLGKFQWHNNDMMNVLTDVFG